MAPFVRLYKFDYTTPIEAMINAHYHYIKISLCVHVSICPYVSDEVDV